MVPKLKLEHLDLTVFSKMHVDLAAQVGYLAQWETSVKKSLGFSGTEKNMMLLSGETLYGVKMTCEWISPR